MKKSQETYLSLCFSILALSISVVSMLLFFHRSSVSLPTLEGILIAVLTILVTALVGWQIYTVIDIKSSSEKVISTVEKLRKKFWKKQKENEMRNDERLTISLAQTALAFCRVFDNNESAKIHALALLMNALIVTKYKKNYFYGDTEEAHKRVLEELKKIRESLGEKRQLDGFLKEEIEQFYEAALHTKQEWLIHWVKSFTPRCETEPS